MNKITVYETLKNRYMVINERAEAAWDELRNQIDEAVLGNGPYPTREKVFVVNELMMERRLALNDLVNYVTLNGIPSRAEPK